MALSAIFCVLFTIGGIELHRRFPISYAWTELMIDYRGGFVRRGLLGEIGWQLQPFVSLDALFSIAMALLYAGTATWMVVLVCGNPTVAGFMFLVSPATLTVAMYDFEAFGRKDILFIAGFCLAVSLLRRVDNRTLMAGLLMLLYFPLGLTHELAWCYYPLAGALLVIREQGRASRRWMLGFAAASIVYLLAGLALVSTFRGTPDVATIIADSWRAIFPLAFNPGGNGGALSFLPQSLPQGLALFSFFLAPQTVFYYVVGFALALLPLALYLPGRGIARHLAAPLPALATAAGVLCMLASFAIAYDWGRMVYLFVIHAFIFVAVLAPSPIASTIGQAREQPQWDRSLVYAAALIALYMLTWRLAHSSPEGGIPLKPGTLFRLLPSTFAY